MHDRRNPLKRPRELVEIREIGDDEFKSLRKKTVAARKVIVENRLITAPPQSVCRVAANVSGSSYH